MRLFLRSLIALVYLVSATLAEAGFVVNSFQFGSATPAFSYRNTYSDTTNLTTYSYASADIGTAHAQRIIIVGAVPTATGGSRSVSSMDICGVSGSLVQGASSASRVVELWQAAVTTGTTCTIDVTWSGAQTGSIIHVWAGYPTSATKVDSAAGDASSATSCAALNVAKTDLGFTVMVGRHATGGSTLAFTQNGAETVVENHDAQFDSAPRIGGASHINTATTTTDDYTLTTAGAADGCAIAAASWGP